MEKAVELGTSGFLTSSAFFLGTNEDNKEMSIETASNDWKRWASLQQVSLNQKDAPVLMDHAPWRTEEELIAEKRKFRTFSPEPDSPERDLMYHAIEQQPLTKHMFSETYGLEVQQGAIYRHETEDFMVARVNFETEMEPHFPVHILSVGVDNAEYWADKQTPEHVIDEAQWTMAVTGADAVLVACFVEEEPFEKGKETKGHLEARAIYRDEEAIVALEKKAKVFYEKMRQPFLNMTIQMDQAELVVENEEERPNKVSIPIPDTETEKDVRVLVPRHLLRPDVGQWKENSEAYKESHKEGKLSLPVKNDRGQSFVYKRSDGKTMSSGQIYCAVHKMRGRELFANNRIRYKKTRPKEADLER